MKSFLLAFALSFLTFAASFEISYNQALSKRLHSVRNMPLSFLMGSDSMDLSPIFLCCVSVGYPSGAHQLINKITN